MTVRLWSWNVERLSRHLPGGSSTPLDRVLEGWGGGDVLCLQETRMRDVDAEATQAMRDALSGFECQWSSNHDGKNASFGGGRAYGVATYVRGTLEPRSIPNLTWDREGRVTLTELPPLGAILVNVYGVNGTSKPHFDHDLGRCEGDRHRWKRAFIRRLAEELASWRARGHAIIALGDWNVSRTRLDVHPRLRTEEPHATARKLFHEEFVQALDLVDVHRALRPDARDYTWFDRRAEARGQLDAARVDYALVSASLMPRVRTSEILSNRRARHSSDHAPLSVELESR